MQEVPRPEKQTTSLRLKDFFENHPVVFLAATAITAFGFGWGVNDAILKAANNRVISAYEYDRLKTDSAELSELKKEKVVAVLAKPRVKVVFVDTRTGCTSREARKNIATATPISLLVTLSAMFN